MNSNSKLYALFFFFFTFFIPLSQAQIKVSLDNPKHRVSVGESLNFRVSSNNYGEGTYEAYFNPRPNKLLESLVQKGNFTASPGSDGFISLSFNQPGLAFIKVTQNWASATTTFTVSPLSIQPIESEPADFDNFWQQQKQMLAAVPLNPQLNQINNLPNGSKVYILELGSVDNRKVYGYLAVPAGGGKFPAILSFPPFGNSPSQPDPLVVTDFTEKGKAISLYLSVHNAPPNSVDNNAYKPDDLTRRDGFYSRLMILAGLRAIDYLTSRDDFNGNLGITGNSQGGGLALQVAGLDSRVTAVMSLSPSSCEHDGERFMRASGFPYYIQAAISQGLDTNLVFKNMRYYDASYFLKRFKGNLMLLLGYKDDVTPAATQFAAYNQHRGQSSLLHMRELGHNNPWEEYYLGQHAFFSQHLKGFQNTHYFKKQFSIHAGDDIEINAASAKLDAKIFVDGATNNITDIKWSKIEGPGDVVFSNKESLQTAVAFSREGTYVLRLTADHDYKITDPNAAMYYTLSDYITIKVGQVNNACNVDTEKPVFTTCPQNITLFTTENTAVVTWQMPTATDNCSNPSVSSGFSSGQAFPLGTTVVNYTAVDTKGNQATCQFNVSINKTETTAVDLSVNISANTTQYSPFSNIVFKIILKNLSTTPFSNSKVQFKFPRNTVTGGTVFISGRVTSDWREWCRGGIQCFEWDVNNLLGLDSATLTLPLFVLKASDPIEATATILSSTPVDNNRNNNQASITIFPINSNALDSDESFSLYSKRASTQTNNMIILSPTVVVDDFKMDITSPMADNIQFNIVNSFGVTVQSELRRVEKGQNILKFGIAKLPQDAYFIIPKTKFTPFSPVRFIKF